MFCVYCGVDHPPEVAVSDEHVVPYAIGGTNALTIQVCQDSNNKLGGLVDKPFIEMFLVHSKRFFLGLVGTDGTEPVLNLSGNSTIKGQESKVVYRIDSNENKQLKIGSPTVSKRQTEDGEQWTVSGDPGAVRRILEGKLRSLAGENKEVKDSAGETLTLERLDEMMAAIPVEQIQPTITKTIQVSRLDCIRFFAKIGLSVGHYALAERFSRSSFAATLRNVMRAGDLAEAQILATRVWPTFEGADPFRKLFTTPGSHILALLPSSPPDVYINLFGEFDALVPLDSAQDDAHGCNVDGRVLAIELPSRRLRDLSLADFIAQLRPQGDTPAKSR